MEDFDNIKLMSKRANIATFSGLRLDYLEPTVGMINIIDIAHGTSKNCRFAGQCRGWYSVARHEVLVSYRVEEMARKLGLPEPEVVRLAFKALFHDGAESYMNDCPSPLKRLLKSLWTPIEHGLERVIFTAFGITFDNGGDPIERIIHEADEFMYLCEWHDIMNTEKIKDWYYPGDRPSYEEQPRIDNQASWEEDYMFFMERYFELVERSQAASAQRAH